jgi:hypothetical protein
MFKPLRGLNMEFAQNANSRSKFAKRIYDPLYGTKPCGAWFADAPRAVANHAAILLMAFSNSKTPDLNWELLNSSRNIK